MSWKLFFAWVPFAAFAADALFFLVPCRLRWKGWLAGLAALGICAAKNLAYRHLGGDPYWPDLPRVVVIVWDILGSGLVLAVLPALVFALVSFFCPLRVRRCLAVGLAVAVWSVAAVGVWSTQTEPRLVEVEVACPGLSSSLEGLRVAQLTDFHVCAATAEDRIARVVARVNALKPDLVVLTGDYADGWSARKWRILEPLRTLKAKEGVFAVPGNHEYYNGYHPFPQKFADWGIVLLTNTCATACGGAVVLGGVHHEQIAGYRCYGERPDLTKTFRAAPAGAFRILLNHTPKYARRDMSRHRIGLQLSGHTHGGTMPVVHRTVAGFNDGFVRGLYDVDGRPLYVSAGMGEWGKVPVRLFDPTEITLLTLKRK